MKTQIYNLIILDESGSMEDVVNQTISGCNETINTIISAQKKYAETQEHFISIYVFQSNDDNPSHYLIKNQPALNVKHITAKDYQPWGGTPLNDAVGATLVDLKAITKQQEKAIGSVTIITDGMENSSEHYSTYQVAMLIDSLKELGWNFNFIGANIDVEATASQYNIDNALEFEQDAKGTEKMFACQSASRMAFYNRISEVDASCCNEKSERIAKLKHASKNFFQAEQKPRISPDTISKLKKDEIFVFGSNLQGAHGGGAAYVALKKFGAILGQGTGLQGQSYAIPTMHGGVDVIRPYVKEFIAFAIQHPKLKFLVTRIGCGIAGFTDEEIAPLFATALEVENIYLPESFIKVLTQ